MKTSVNNLKISHYYWGKGRVRYIAYHANNKAFPLLEEVRLGNRKARVALKKELADLKEYLNAKT